MKNPFSRIFRARDKPTDAVSAAPNFYFGTSGAGKNVTVNTAIQETTVYACIRVIAETVASLPLAVYKETKEGTEKASDHSLYRIIHDEPNHEMSSFIWREVMLTHLLLFGNSYSQIVRNGRGQVLELYPLLPDHMEVDRDKDGNLTYTYTTSEGNLVRIRPDDVLHIPGLGFDGVMGYSPIAVCKNAVGLGIAAEEYGSKFFSNGARPSGILTHPNTVKDPKALRESWNSAYGGSSNGNKVAVLEEGMHFQALSIPNNEAQFLETRKFQVDEICRLYRVPPHLIGNLEHATYSNIEHQNISFAVHTIRPWLVRIEQAMNNKLFTDKEKGKFYCQFNMDGLMRGDYKSRMEGYAIARQNGWMSTNDIRSLENMNPVPEEEGGNAYLVNGNMVPITYALLMQDKINLEILKTVIDTQLELVEASQKAEENNEESESQNNEQDNNQAQEEPNEEAQPTENKRKSQRRVGAAHKRKKGGENA